ncbi:hypothetical protein SNE40_000651 [Patella caerulea]|uniref:Uncharacterized protein n=1 Tax=Patella caerulea TaxID=87958 RepID=A0AAN8KGZ0_PATCE
MMNWVAIVVSYFLALIKKVTSKIIPTPPDTKITQEATEADFLPSCFVYPHQLNPTQPNISVTFNPAQIISQTDISQNNPDDNIANSSDEDKVFIANTVTEQRCSKPYQDFTPNETEPYQDFIPNEIEPYQEFTPYETEPHQEHTPNETAPEQEFTPYETEPHQEHTPIETAPEQEFTPYETEPHQEYTPHETAPEQEFTPYETEPHQEYTPNETAPEQEFTPYETEPHQEHTPIETAPEQEFTPYETEPHQEYTPHETAPEQEFTPYETEPHQEHTPIETAPEQEFTPYETEPHQEYTPHETAPEQEFTPYGTEPDQGHTPNETAPNEEITPNETAISVTKRVYLKDKVDWLKPTDKVQADMNNTCAMHGTNVKIKISEGMSWEEILKEYSSLSPEQNDERVIDYLVDNQYLPRKDSHERTLQHYKINGMTNDEFKSVLEKMRCPDMRLKTKQTIGRILHQFKPGTYFLYHYEHGPLNHVTLLSTEIRGKKPLFFDPNGGCDKYYEFPNSRCDKYLKDKVD